MKMNFYIKSNAKEEINQIVARLSSATIFEFSNLSGPSALPAEKGVYIIFDKFTKEVLYVGKTTNLRQRLYSNHLMGPLANARLKKYLIDDAEYPDIKDLSSAKDHIRKKCAFLYLLEEDYRKRGHLEGLLSFLCDCRYVDLEH